MPQRVVLAALLGVLSLAALGCGRSSRRPDVVLISIDCLNQRQLEQSTALGRAPNLARLAQDALVFHRGYAHAPWTTPSHMSMLTGLHPSQHGRDIPYGLMIRFRGGDDRVPLYQSPLFFDAVCSGHSPCAKVPREELYDLSSDPFEETDLLKGSPGKEAMAALERLRARLAAHINLPPAYRHRLTVGGSSPDQLDDSTREALRALGYIQ